MKFYKQNFETNKVTLEICPHCGSSNLDMINTVETEYECLTCDEVFLGEEANEQELSEDDLQYLDEDDEDY